MKHRTYWGLTALVILIIGVTVFSVLKDQAETQRLKDELERAMHGHIHADGDPAHSDGKEDDQPDVRIEETKQVDVPQRRPNEIPIAKTPKPKPKKPLYTGPWTFHEELLKTNPVKALRLQQEERGHWSAEWIPPFPTDDTEAQEYAKAVYLVEYYWHTYGKKLDTPEYEKEAKAYDKFFGIESQMYDTIRSYPYGARKMDLMKLTWHSLDDEPVGGAGGHPSEYFGDPEARELMKKHGGWDY